MKSDTAIPALPSNIESEQALLGSLMLDREAIAKVSGFLRPEDFYGQAHGVIYAAILRLDQRDEPPSLQAMVDELERQGRLVEVGNVSYLAGLPTATPTASYAEHFGRLIEKAAMRRSLIRAAGHIVQRAYEIDDVDGLITESEGMLYELRQHRQSSKLITPGERMSRAFVRYEAAQQGQHEGLDFGFIDLDRLTKGAHPGEMILIAARPSVGKTALMHNMAERQAQVGKHVLFCTAEQPESQLTDRWVAAESGYSVHGLEQGEISEEGLRRIAQALATGANRVPHAYDDSHMTTAGIRALATEMRSKCGLDALYVDYLQLLHDTAGQGETERVTRISRQLKGIARALNVPVIVASQLNRMAESRADKKPQLSDLRESGSLEQDADVVMLLFRPEASFTETEWRNVSGNNERTPYYNVCDVIIAKQRNGPRGITITLGFDAAAVRFKDHERMRQYEG